MTIENLEAEGAQSVSDETKDLNVTSGVTENETPTSEETANTEQQEMISKAQHQELMGKLAAQERKRGHEQAMRQFQQTAPQPADQTAGNAPSQADLMHAVQAYQASQEAERITSEFIGKIDNARYSDPQFGELFDRLNLGTTAPILAKWLNALDNTVATTKDLAQNPAKFANILMLVNSGAPEMASQALRDLSATIKTNEAAKSQKQAPSPLSQTKPSNLGMSDGDMSGIEAKRNYLRGRF